MWKWIAERYTAAFQKKNARKKNGMEKIQGVETTPTPFGSRGLNIHWPTATAYLSSSSLQGLLMFHACIVHDCGSINSGWFTNLMTRIINCCTCLVMFKMVLCLTAWLARIDWQPKGIVALSGSVWQTTIRYFKAYFPSVCNSILLQYVSLRQSWASITYNVSIWLTQSFESPATARLYVFFQDKRLLWC